MAYPKYSGNDIRCPKCRMGTFKTTHQKGELEIVWGKGPMATFYLKTTPNTEHLHRRCASCSYTWKEATADETQG